MSDDTAPQIGAADVRTDGWRVLALLSREIEELERESAAG